MPSSAATLQIPSRFNGPPRSGNGGWVAGELARLINAHVADVSLHAPPPLDRQLAVRVVPTDAASDSQDAVERLELFDADTLLASASPASALELTIPPLPDWAQIEAAGFVGRQRAAARPDSPYVRCFVCGIARDDGLRIAAGQVGDRDLVATPWTPPADLAQPDGGLPVPLVWAALDCPAGIAWGVRLGNSVAMMTVRMTATIDRPLRADRTYAVLGWPIEQQGRKLHAGTAIVDRDGVVHARSRQLWLLPRQDIQ